MTFEAPWIFLAITLGGLAFAGVLLLRWRTQQAFTELGSLLHRATGEIEELVPSVQRTVDEMESEITALHCAIDDLRAEIKSIRAAAPPGVDHPPRAGADLTSPAPAVSLGAPRCMVPPAVSIDEEQRRSFAFGNCNIDNPSVTREMVDRAAERMAASDEDDGA